MSTALILDQARFIKENAHEVEVAIVFGGAMAILIILIFMLDLRSTIISAVALPTSVIGTFFVMYVLGYTLNMMTLLGLSLAIGLLIDDAVVVRENIFKHLERGKSPTQAALDGTKEIALVGARHHADHRRRLHAGRVHQRHRRAVLPPVRHHHLGGGAHLAVRRLHARPDAVVALLEDRRARQQGDRFAWLKRPFLAVFDGMDDVYRGVLGWAVRHKLIVGALAIGALVVMGCVGKLMGNEFVNAEDRGQFVVDVELPAGTSLDETDRVSALAEQKLLDRPRGQAGLRHASARTARPTRRAGASSPRRSRSARSALADAQGRRAQGGRRRGAEREGQRHRSRRSSKARRPRRRS